MESTFTFPDSKITIKIERVSYIVLEMMGAAYQSSYPNKPTLPTKKIFDSEGNLTTEVDLPLDPEILRAELKKDLDDATKQVVEQDLKDITTYLELKRKWDIEVNAAHWQATRLLYAKHLISEPDREAVRRVAEESTQFGLDIRKQTLELYAKHGVPFDEQYMDRWLYLWTVCVTSVYDSSALNTWMQTGSSEARQAVRQALFPI